jgi:predicted O-linked N-acetylglucosamine transferase (SPINDLY family)
MSNAPDPFEAEFQSALKLHSIGRIADARLAYQSILAKNPDHGRTLHSLGVLEKNAGHAQAAVELISRAIALHPHAAEFHNNLGDALQTLGRADEAIAAFEKAIDISPTYVKGMNNLAMAQWRVLRFGDAIAMLLRALSLQPEYARAIANLGSVLTQCGRQEEAIACFRRAIELEPEHQTAHHNLLMAMHYVDHDPLELFQAHRNWARRFADPIAPQRPRADPAVGRKLRIGYVSGDFRDHAVTKFFLPVLKNHDRGRFHITCYSNGSAADETTHRIRAASDEWSDIAGLSDDAAAQLVRSDRIDILIDLAGHSARNRLTLFARRTAPVQVTWLGYPNTTGMAAMDYRITDAHADPPGMTESLHSEKLVRLTSCWCYSGDAAVEMEQSARQSPTFGSFNTLAKVTPAMIEMWAKVLNGVAESQMIIKAPAAGDESVRQRVLGEFARLGVAAERVTMLGKEMDWAKHLASYGQIDVMLDTFPYHGTTMTCESLWMGVPVVTLAGKSHVSRVGVSLLSNVGSPELIAKSRDEYVAIATALANDRSRLASMRQSLRAKMPASPLLDAKQFTREIESAFVQMHSEAQR